MTTPIPLVFTLASDTHPSSCCPVVKFRLAGGDRVLFVLGVVALSLNRSVVYFEGEGGESCRAADGA